MLRKILNFGVVFLYAVYDLYKIMQLFYTHIMHVINFQVLDVWLRNLKA
jgi:hypothetical protein